MLEVGRGNADDSAIVPKASIHGIRSLRERAERAASVTAVSPAPLYRLFSQEESPIYSVAQSAVRRGEGYSTLLDPEV